MPNKIDVKVVTPQGKVVAAGLVGVERVSDQRNEHRLREKPTEEEGVRR